jgi:V-type H+-transporting ATPase subunit C
MLIKDWEASYATLADMVVPGSAKRITEDQEHALYTVTLFKKVIEEYKANCRERKWDFKMFLFMSFSDLLFATLSTMKML